MSEHSIGYALARSFSFVALGLLLAAGLIGWPELDPRHVAWFGGDALTSYMGWDFFRHQNSLPFPLGFVTDIGFPRGQAIAYLDSNPLLAVLFWPFRSLLPAEFQYAGLYLALCSILQLFFGYRLCRRLAVAMAAGRPRWWIEAVAWEGAVLFLTAPAFLFRASGSFTLNSHWLVLAALDLFFGRGEVPARRFLLRALALAFLADGIQPYFEVMALLVLGAGFVEAGFEVRPPDAAARGRLTFPLLGLNLLAITALAAFWLFGFIQPGKSADQYIGWGYGHYSMNLLAPFDSRGWGVLPALPGEARGLQLSRLRHAAAGGGGPAAAARIAPRPDPAAGPALSGHFHRIAIARSVGAGDGGVLSALRPRLAEPAVIPDLCN